MLVSSRQSLIPIPASWEWRKVGEHISAASRAQWTQPGTQQVRKSCTRSEFSSRLKKTECWGRDSASGADRLSEVFTPGILLKILVASDLDVHCRFTEVVVIVFLLAVLLVVLSKHVHCKFALAFVDADITSPGNAMTKQLRGDERQECQDYFVTHPLMLPLMLLAGSHVPNREISLPLSLGSWAMSAREGCGHIHIQVHDHLHPSSRRHAWLRHDQ